MKKAECRREGPNIKILNIKETSRIITKKILIRRRRSQSAPPVPPPAASQPMDELRSRPVAICCRRRRGRLPGHSPTGVSPIGRGDQNR